MLDKRAEIKGISEFSPGLIQNMLKKCYATFFDCFPEEKERLFNQWEREDCDAFENLHIGSFVSFTCINNLPVGYFSWDPRKFPLSIIGQNCILPEYRGQGYGSKQIEWIIDWFREWNFTEVTATTGNHEFFHAAQQMYKKCGF